jgi:hypothetical protein
MNSLDEANVDSNQEPKITIAFRGYGWLKSRLAEKATAMGFSVSEYCELRFIDDVNSESPSYLEKLDHLNDQIAKLGEKLSFYEASKLQEHFKRLRGKEIHFVDVDGNEVNVVVNTMQDAYKILVHSFQIGENI